VGRRLSRLSVWACLALLPWTPSPARAQADGPWTSWRIGALVRALAVQGDSIWIGTANGMLNFHIPTEQHRVYTTKDGLLSNVILGITVGPKGDVWIGTYGGGLTRFDGKSRWTTYTPYGAGMTGDYRASYARYKPGDGLGDLWVYQTLFRPDGTLWAATWKGASRYNGKTFTTYTTTDGLADKWVYSMAVDREGRFWFGTEGGVTRYDGKTWKSWTHADGLGADAPTPDSRSSGAYQAPSPHHQQAKKTIADYNPNYVLSAAIDAGQVKWFGTWGGGLARFDGKTWKNYTTRDGLAGNVVGAIAIDPRGVLWIGTDAGVSRFDGSRFTNFTTADGLFHDAVYAVAIDKTGAKWFGAYGGVSRYTGN
jgi:ligand-binding sensor domain-containing protein